MLNNSKMAACAAVWLCLHVGQAKADEAISPIQFLQQKSESDLVKNHSAHAVTGKKQQGARKTSSVETARTGLAGSIVKQTNAVATGCLPVRLTQIIREASAHFGSAAVITSGYRHGRHSYHGKCMAADVQIAGVSPASLARYFRAQPGVGGVGTYAHTRSVHVDVAGRVYTWYHGRRGRSALLTTDSNSTSA